MKRKIFGSLFFVMCMVLSNMFMHFEVKATYHANLGPDQICKTNCANLGPDNISNGIDESGKIVKVQIDDSSYLMIDEIYVDEDMEIHNMLVVPSNTVTFSDDGGAGAVIRPNFYGKTMTLTKPTNSFPDTTEYSEFNSTYSSWYSGTLRLQTVKWTGNNYIATYTGLLIKQNW